MDITGGNGRARRTALAAVASGQMLVVFFALSGIALAQQGSDFFTVTPCRVYDSRWGEGPLVGSFDRQIPVGGYCGIPPDATAAPFNVTAVDPNSDGWLRLYPCCAAAPNNVLGFRVGMSRASNATLGLGVGGKVAAFIDGPYSTAADLVLDVSGYFRPPATVQQWREWEAILISPENYTQSGGDPYSDVELDIRFTKAATGETFVQPAFWDDEAGDPRTFKVRAAFPPGTWSWQVESCTRFGASCAAGWTPSQGSVVVQSNTSSGNPLYDRGFVKQFETKSGGAVVAESHLVFPDLTHFTWVGDTAWAAPPRQHAGHSQPAEWIAYLNDRRAKGFNLIQLAPAVTWKPRQDDPNPFRPLPDAPGFSFRLNPLCPQNPPPPIPSPTIPPCWNMIGSYWTRFENMVREAHAREMVVAVVGVMNPTGIDRDSRYPTASRPFVRGLTARLGFFDVIYSPAFDDDRRQIDTGTGQPRSVLMNNVGQLLRELVRNNPPYGRPITNHLAGGRSNCDDYRFFAPTTNRWMSYYLFQSGHGGTDVPAGPCRSTAGSYVERAIERAHVMPFTLDSYTNPSLPAVNAEGPYDAFDYAQPHPEVDTRYRSRHAAYLGALSNAVGYSYGAIGLSLWDQPGGNFANEIQRYYTLPSSNDMRHFGTLFKSDTRVLNAHHDWIRNNPTAQLNRQVLASDDVGFVIAYLPGDEPVPIPPAPRGSRNIIEIDSTRLPCQACPAPSGSPWTFTWVNPTTGGTLGGGSCSGPPGGVTLTFQRPSCDAVQATNPQCDFVLRLERTGSCPSGGSSALSLSEMSGKAETGGPAASALEVWSDASAGDGTSAIYAASNGKTGRDESILLSPPGRAFQIAPRVDRVGSKQLVVWQADGLDGSLYGIYGALVGPTGEVEGPFKINHYTEHDQREPAVVGGIGGDALVVWSSYDQDGHRGGIYGRFVHAIRPVGNVPQDYLGEEFQIAEETAGHQQHPQVVSDAGGFWVAWETVGDDGLRSTLSLRRLGLAGKPEAPEVQLHAPPGEQRKLVVLEESTPGSVVARWWGQDARGESSRHEHQLVGPEGPLGPVTSGGD